MPTPKMRPAPLRQPISLLLARSTSAGWAASSLMPIELAQCRFEIGDELRVGSLAGSAAGDDHVIGSRLAPARQHFGCGHPQPPLCPVTDHPIADLAARCEADPYPLAAVCFHPPRRRL